jgi:hypothetical protein
MRVLVVIVALALPTSALADGNLELVGGISIPAGDSNWTNIADTSPKLGARIGAMRDDIGGMLQLDWTPVNLKNMGGSFGVGDASAAAYAFRVLADFAFQHHVRPNLVISARAGLGIDVAHGSGQVTILGVTSSTSSSDVGLAVEFGGGLWYDFGGTQVGGELAVPIGNHSSKGTTSDPISFQYASYDVDILLGVRLRGF